ncbi:MAG TPA: nicotinate phosphoribosyltransferase, partial [Trinickia sp.]|nr:nicotinate phosphoribosyltransferase [Trinickia sp.]
FPAANVEYRFRCRTPNIDLVPYVGEIRDEVRKLCRLRFSEDDLDYLRRLRFIKSDFVDFLALFHLSEKHISIEPSPKGNGEIDIVIAGPWLHTILFEIPVLAIVNEVYFRNTQRDPDYVRGRARLEEKISLLGARPEFADCKIADYGTRRRFSKRWHEEVLLMLMAGIGEQFAGTSNVYYAKKHDLTPLGTMAHEYLQACQSLGPRLRDSQTFGFEMWAKEYRGDLGIALSDVYGMKAFLRDFDMYFCKLFDGARHDSGDPFEWGEQLLRHYEENRCDSRTKTLVFSDALDIPKVLQLYERFRGRCRLAFGVGTNLTNDLGYDPLQIVIKMVRCNGQPVAKLSDSPGKNMCDDKAYLAYLRQVFGIETPAGDTAD